MDELIARLEKATGPDRRLDQAIAKRFERVPKVMAVGGSYLESPRYTASIDAAMMLIDDDTRYLSLVRDVDEYGGQWHATYRRMFFGHAPTPAIALCIAALKARHATAPRAPAADEVR